MKKYTGFATECKKCGSDETADHYDSGKILVPGFLGISTVQKLEPEYIRRTCMNCGYTWKEAPLDSED